MDKSRLRTAEGSFPKRVASKGLEGPSSLGAARGAFKLIAAKGRFTLEDELDDDEVDDELG